MPKKKNVRKPVKKTVVAKTDGNETSYVEESGSSDPEQSKPEGTKPEETKPEETKPEETKPEETKSEETKPEETNPESQVPHDNLNPELQLNASDSSPSPGPFVRKPMPKRTQKRMRPTRMRLLPPTNKPQTKTASALRMSPAKWCRASNSPLAGASSGTQKSTSRLAAGPSYRRVRRPVNTDSREDLPRAVPRTRVLVTPERSSPSGTPSNRQLRTPERDAPRFRTGRAVRKLSQKSKHMQIACRLQAAPNPNSSESDTSSSIFDSLCDDSPRVENSSWDHSDDEDSDGEPQPQKRK